MSEGSSESPRKVHRLSIVQSHQLYQWLLTNQKRFTEERTTAPTAAIQATAALGFPVSRSHVHSIMGNGPGCIIKHQWRKPPQPAAAKAGGSGSIASRLDYLEALVKEMHAVIVLKTAPLFQAKEGS